MFILSKIKKYSFYLWLLAAILFFASASSIYQKYAAKQIIDKTFGTESEMKVPSQAAESNGYNKVKPEKNAKGMPLVPDFTLKNEKGDSVSLSDYNGKVVILNFWASWCPPCKAEMPEFKKMNDELKKSKDAVLLTINLTDGQRETKEKALKFLKDNNYDFTVLFDEESTVANIFGIQSIPTTVIIDKEGYLYDYTLGAITKSAVLKSVGEVK